MAEFITFTRSDVTVFMRRGQFYEKPNMRRSGDAEDMFATNTSTDYEDQKPPAESKPLADTWLKTQDTRKYAEILTRYNPPKNAEDRQSEVVQVPSADRASPVQVPPREFHLKPTPIAPIISIMPNSPIPTVSWGSGSSKIMMRNFQPLQEHTMMNKHMRTPETLYPTRSTRPQSILIISPKEQANGNIRDDIHEDYVPMRVWGTTARAKVIHDDPDDVDEDNIVYKPV